MFTYMLKSAKRELEKSLQTKDGYLLFFELNIYLHVLFLIREKFNGKYEAVNFYKGLKFLYNIYKHDYNPCQILNCLVVKDGIEVVNPLFMPLDEF